MSAPFRRPQGPTDRFAGWRCVSDGAGVFDTRRVEAWHDGLYAVGECPRCDGRYYAPLPADVEVERRLRDLEAHSHPPYDFTWLVKLARRLERDVEDLRVRARSLESELKSRPRPADGSG